MQVLQQRHRNFDWIIKLFEQIALYGSHAQRLLLIQFLLIIDV
jgi:hypothetical protein